MVKIRYRLPNPRELRIIRQAVARGVSPARIAEAVLGSNHKANVVHGIIRERDLWDTYIDWIAVDRALAGDEDVWLNLTHYERAIVLERADGVGRKVWHDVWGFRSSMELGAARFHLRRYAAARG